MKRESSSILTMRYPILAAIGLITLVLGTFSLRIDLNQKPDELLYKDDPAYPQLQAFFEQFGYDEIVVAAYATDHVLDRPDLEIIRRITEQLSQLQGVTRVVSLGNAEDVFVQDGSLEIAPLLRALPESAAEQESLRKRVAENPLYRDLLITRDGQNALFDITLDARLSEGERDGVLEGIDSIFAREADGKRYYLAGSPIGRSEGFRCMRRDFSTLLPIGMLLLILSMYLAFRNYLCVLLPFVAVSLSVIWTVGFMYLAGSELNVFSVLIPTILFIAGTADCIHILSQYQDCRFTCRTKAEAIRETIRLMRLPCFLTSLTTMAGFASLGACRLAPLKLFGIFSALGMGFAFVLALTILPIGLSLADTRMLSLRRPPSDSLLGILERVGRFGSSHRGGVLVAAGLVLALGIYGTTQLKVETDPGKFFSSKMKMVTDMHYIEQEIGGFIPFFVVVEGQEEDRIKDPALLRKIDLLGEFIRKQAGVDQVVSASDLIKYMNYRMNDNDPAGYRIPESRNAVAELLLAASLSDGSGLLTRFFDESYSTSPVAIRFRHHDFYSYSRLMDAVLPYLETEFGSEASVKTYVTGTNMMLANTFMPILSGLKESLLLAAVAIFAVMIFLFRSARMAVIGMVPNLIPILLTLGTMGLFGISLNFMTAPIAAIALGLAIDDTIHFLTRFKREFRTDRDYAEAIQRTLRSSGKPILLTTLILTGGFLIFLFSNFQYTRSMGILISFTMISAVLGDLILLPVLLLLCKPLGKGELSLRN